MQRRPTGTIPVVCAGFQKGPRRAEKVQVPDVCVCVEGTPQTQDWRSQGGCSVHDTRITGLCATHTTDCTRDDPRRGSRIESDARQR